MKIDSCLIIKNEENNISNVINQLLQFSSNIYIVDTGSTDSTINIINSFIENHNNICLHHYVWNNNFAVARNYSLSLSQDGDYIFWCDGDEVLSEKFVEQLIEFSQTEYDDNMPDIYSYGVRTKNTFLGTISDIYNRYGLFKSNQHSNISFIGVINEQVILDGHSINTTKYSGHMVTNYLTKSSDSRIMNLRSFIEEQNNKENISNRDLYFLGKELENAGMMYYAYLMYIECIFSDNLEYITDALYRCALLYRDYSICKSTKIISISDVVDKMFEKNILNRGLLQFMGKSCLSGKQHKSAAKCSLKAYNLKEDNCVLVDNVTEYSERTVLFDIVLALDGLKDYKSANMYNNAILAITSEDDSAKWNRDYFSRILNS